MENVTPELNYTLFDRQLTVFVNAIGTLVTGWHEYSATELSMDLHSLCIKGARLCYIADQDAVWQKEDLAQTRVAENNSWCETLSDLLRDQLAPMVMEVTGNFRKGIHFSGVKIPRFKGEYADFLSYLQDSLGEDDVASPEQKLQMLADARLFQDIIRSRRKKVHEGEPDVERFWSLVQVYALTCYIYYHFVKLTKDDSPTIDVAEAERILTRAVRDYSNSEEGSRVLKTFHTRLMFENDGRQLSRNQIMDAGKRLVDELPGTLQYCYMEYRNDMAEIAAEVLSVKPSADDLRQLVIVIAKWQMLQELIFRMDNPSLMPPQETTIFNTMLNGRTLDLEALKSSIGRMVAHVKYKNQWFCVWCVLKHHNLLADLHFQAFADQMMQPDWFGNGRAPYFQGENISDYSDYLGQTDFTLWRQKDFQDYRVLHGKPEKKWSDKLFRSFWHLCYEMDECLKC